MLTNSIKYFFVAVSILLLIASCSDDKKSESITDEIVFWHFWSEPYQRIEMNKLISKFEIENNCKVKVSELSWGDGKSKLLTAFSSGTAPDVLELGSDWVAQFSSAGVLAEFTSEEAQIEQYIDFSTAPCYWDNKIYALPWIVDTRVLFINNDLVKQAGLINGNPINYDQLINFSDKVNELEGVYGFGATGSDQHRLYKKIIPMFWTFGGDVLKNGKPVINSSENVLALEKYAELSRYGMIETQRQLDAAFVRGEIGYCISGGWLIEKIKNENTKLNYSVSLLPGISEEKGFSFAGGEYFAVNNKSNVIELSKKFINYITDGKNAIEFCKVINEAGFPADKNYFQDPFYNNYPNRLVFADQLKFSKMTPVHPKWLDIEYIIENKTVEVLYGKLTAEEALAKAQIEIENVLK